jgi:hypothetical protein
VKRQEIVAGVKGFCDSDSYRLLSDTGKPLAEFSLTEQKEHLLFNQSWKKKCLIEVKQGLVGETGSVKFDRSARSAGIHEIS